MALATCPGAAGVDEAGRGPLAGPVVAAAVVLPPDFDLEGIMDSKKLRPAQREAAAARIRAGTAWSVAVVGVADIDRLNIRQATLQAMRLAVEGLPATPARVLVDGDTVPPGLAVPAEAVVKGDATWAEIAAASILAKTERDRIVLEFAACFPGYGFERHLGYGTAEHMEALRRLGPCPEHRRSFAPVAAALEQPCLILDA